MTPAKIIGIIAGILSLLATIPYILAILRKTTKPSRATWFIWSMVSIILAFNYHQIGGGEAIWVSMGYAIGVTIIALLSIRHGQGGWSKLDKICFAGVTISLFIWWYSGSALWSLFSILTVDVLGAVPTVWKSYKNPESEDRFAWILGFAANLLNLFAVQIWTLSLALYPLYLALMTGVVTTLIVFPHHKTNLDLKSPQVISK